MKVSVVIPTLNREEFILDTLKDLMSQSYQDYEVIVVDQSDKLNKKVKDFVLNNKDKIKYYYNLDFKGLPSARNFGWQFAEGEIVIYIDDDVRLGNDFIKYHVESYKDNKIGAVAGGIDEKHRKLDIREPVGDFNYWTATPYRGFASKKTQYVSHFPGGNFSVKKKIIEKCGGFDENLNFGAALYEETDASLRIKNLGYRILFNPEARLLHLAAPSGGCRVFDVEKYMRGLAHNRTILIERHLEFYYKPTAYFRLLLLGLSYSKTSKSFLPFKATFEGIKLGKKSVKKGVLCTNYKERKYCII